MLISELPTLRRDIIAPQRQGRPGLPRKILGSLARPGASACFSLALLLAVGAYGTLKGGHYAAFVAKEGKPADFLAKWLGFSIKAVTISGERELKEQDILSVADIGPRNSLLFLDAAKIRERLKQLPLVKEAAVTKLYPGGLLIEIEERQPFALWQSNGETQIVAADGVPLAPLRGRRFVQLPLVAGAGANENLGQYVVILEAAGDLRERILAGVRVSGRRWTLKTANGIDILLPEIEPEAAMARFAGLERTYHLFEKDILSLDLRQPGRMVARLSEEAAAERMSALARKAKAKGGRT
ncbi:MAG: FtsQ-type POTRA domain-containing protein [Beijerinckiaceae bacterium]|nr:FtsQ-type POTRA domain-containing protein [Beijerinckiaceae bacterium]